MPQETISREEFIRRYGQQPAVMEVEEWRKKYGQPAEMQGATTPEPPTPPIGTRVPGGFVGGGYGFLSALGKAIMNPMPGAETGMDSPAVKLLAAAATGGAATQGMGLVEGLKNAPLVQAGKSVVQKLLPPSTARAGAKFDVIQAAAKNIPVNTAQADEAVLRAMELRTRGSTLPKVLNDYIKNRQAAGATQLTYEAGRDFASNAGALSRREATALNAKMQAQVSQFAQAMKEANREAAAKVGMGELYDQAMKEYARAKSVEEIAQWAKKWALRAGLTALGIQGARELWGN